MPKNYINNAVIGNSSMLGCIGERGELIRLFWPNIDYPQHLDSFKLGIFRPDSGRGTMWLDSESWVCEQRYLPDTNILETVYTSADEGLRILLTDFILPDKPVLVRHLEFQRAGEGWSMLEHGHSGEEGYQGGAGHSDEAGHSGEAGHSDVSGNIRVVAFSSCVSTNPHLASTLFDYRLDTLIHYRHNYYISISADSPAVQFQIGNNALQAVSGGWLKGNDSIGMMPDGAVSWEPGQPAPGGRRSLTVYICASHTLKGARELSEEAGKSIYGEMLERTVFYWTGLLGKARRVRTGNKEVDMLYRRSVLVFSLMADKSGGLLASPEIDEEFTKCGRYAYCWGRDAAFITAALDWCGLSASVEEFYRWAARFQEPEGFWQQRYHMDGNLAPSWGLQVDETGTLVWGMLEHYKATGNRAFLEEMWESARKAVTFLLSYVDRDTGLPWLSFDLWEERLGEHAYSTAAVYAGIMAGCRIGEILGAPPAALEDWRKGAEAIKAALLSNFYKEEQGRFIRSVRVKLNPWGEEHGGAGIQLKLDNKGNYRDFTREDRTVDISLLGLCIPFGVLDAKDERMERTAGVVDSVLAGADAGGLLRYEHDGYMGGNPWVISTLWHALYSIERKDYGKALHHFQWAVGTRTGLGLLPEQADKDTGKPAWVIPLTWSHAMFVLALGRLLGEGVL